MIELLKIGEVVNIIRGQIVVLEDGPKIWSYKITHNLD